MLTQDTQKDYCVKQDAICKTKDHKKPLSTSSGDDVKMEESNVSSGGNDVEMDDSNEN